MSFGLSNTPAAFQWFMNKVFGDLLDMFVVVYLNDILIYSNNLEDHQGHVKEVLKRLWKHKLYASSAKCVFHKESVKFLGFILGPKGLTMDEQKVKTIRDWPISRRIKEIQSFLGFSNFHRRFIHNYSRIIAPLTFLTQKKVFWH